MISPNFSFLLPKLSSDRAATRRPRSNRGHFGCQEVSLGFLPPFATTFRAIICLTWDVSSPCLDQVLEPCGRLAQVWMEAENEWRHRARNIRPSDIRCVYLSTTKEKQAMSVRVYSTPKHLAKQRRPKERWLSGNCHPDSLACLVLAGFLLGFDIATRDPATPKTCCGCNTHSASRWGHPTWNLFGNCIFFLFFQLNAAETGPSLVLPSPIGGV